MSIIVEEFMNFLICQKISDGNCSMRHVYWWKKHIHRSMSTSSLSLSNDVSTSISFSLSDGRHCELPIVWRCVPLEEGPSLSSSLLDKVMTSNSLLVDVSFRVPSGLLRLAIPSNNTARFLDMFRSTFNSNKYQNLSALFFYTANLIY